MTDSCQSFGKILNIIILTWDHQFTILVNKAFFVFLFHNCHLFGKITDFIIYAWNHLIAILVNKTQFAV